MTEGLIFKGAIGFDAAGRSQTALMEEGLRRAQLGGHHLEEVLALIFIAGAAADVRDIERAADLFQRARDTAARYELRSLELGAQTRFAEILLWKGDLAAAEDAVTAALGTPSNEILALRLLGVIQARRGRSSAGALLDRMWELASASGELQHMDPGASVLAECLWLTGDDAPETIEVVRGVLERGVRSASLWPTGALAFWMWKLGCLDTIPERIPDCYRWIMVGQWQLAAEFWESRGVPYEHALALMHGGGDARLRAIEIFETLGAAAAANRVRRELLDEGVRVPRGRARSTRDNVAGLTARQAEVLELLANGHTNAEIADRLFVSLRTAENHVSAILMKLDVSSREEAVVAARDRGLITAH